MAGVHAQSGRLLLTFQFAHNGSRIRCREFLGLADTRENRRLAARIAAQVERDLAAGSFEYAARFPGSRMPRRLGLRSAHRPVPTLAEYARQWLQAHRAHLTAGTFYDYGLLIKNQIASVALGALAVNEVSRRDIDRWMVELQESGVGPRRLNMALARLRTIFRLAEEEGLTADSPARLVRSLREPRAAIDPFTGNERQALLRAALPGTERAFVATLMLAGMRPSEALGLQWRDVDLRRKVISVRRARTRWGDGMTKTEASEREVDMVAQLAVELSALEGTGRAGDFIFTGPRGAVLDWNNFRQRSWRRLVGEAGVRLRPPCQCRHTFAANLLADGANPHYVAHQMGHSTLAMGFRHYARWARKPARDTRESEVAAL
ncbi:MAG TPA: tyrosine-type recombinase/integrase [Candidatus Binataceae bacterium]|nr:tyrosine-type recombinase/integrase [Candidatus Binataceae bacterium]